MAKKKAKCNCPEEGAPLWVLTYGDLMSLLLVFFILILSFSELKRPPLYKRAVEEIQSSFLNPITVGTLSWTQRNQDIPLKSPTISSGEDPSIVGREPAVTTVRDGTEYTRGGRVIFEPGSSVLTETARGMLVAFAQTTVGLNTKLELRGHTAPLELGEDAGEQALWDLSYRRASAVKDYLISRECGIRPERIRIVAIADHEPVVARAWSAHEQAPNRRVSIVSLDTLLEDFRKPELR